LMDQDGFTTMNFMQTVFRAPGSQKDGPVETVALRLSMPTVVFARVADVFIAHKNQLVFPT
jgi:hypothetical protein